MVVGPVMPAELQRLRNLRLGKITKEDLEGYVLTKEEAQLLKNQGVSYNDNPKWLQRLHMNGSNSTAAPYTGSASDSTQEKKLDKLFDPNKGLNDEVRNEILKNVSNMSERFTKG